MSRGTDRLVLVCVAVTRPPPAPPLVPPQPTNPAAFDPKTIERFARSMVEGGPIIEDLAMKNNVNNPNYRSVGMLIDRRLLFCSLLNCSVTFSS